MIHSHCIFNFRKYKEDTIMFTFKDFPKLSERDMQKVLRDTDFDVIAKAVCGEENRPVFIAVAPVMSRRAAKMLRARIAENGEVSKDEVLRCQDIMLKKAYELAESGDITLFD